MASHRTPDSAHLQPSPDLALSAMPRASRRGPSQNMLYHLGSSMASLTAASTSQGAPPADSYPTPSAQGPVPGSNSLPNRASHVNRNDGLPHAATSDHANGPLRTVFVCSFTPSGGMQSCSRSFEHGIELFKHILTEHAADAFLKTDEESLTAYGVPRPYCAELRRRIEATRT